MDTERVPTTSGGEPSPGPALRVARRLGFTVAGIVLLAAGLAMMVLPGPGIVVTLLALALLAREYTWARKLLDVCREKASRTAARAKQRIRS